MAWIVIGENKGKIILISKSPEKGLLPKGAFLTVETENSKFILRVDNSYQHEPFKPSPMIIDMDLSGLYQDQKCKNIIHAYRVKDLTKRTDGLIDFIPPQTIARRANQEEINLALGNREKGPKVFLATIHSGQNQLLIDDKLNYITAHLPEDMYFHQMLICGKTGSGKTVAAKYLAQYFVENYEGAVLAINVKDVDFLKMERPSEVKNKHILKEWEKLGISSHGIENCTIYNPANIKIESLKGVSIDRCQRITLSVHEIEPEALTGLLHNISDVGAQNFPDIFRYWQQNIREEGHSFNNFTTYFINAQNDDRRFRTLNSRGDESEITLHSSTFDNIIRNLTVAVEFFDNEDAKFISADDILQKGKLSVINVAGDKGIQFGSIILRHLLRKIVEFKAELKSEVPILIIIDEVHQFYNTDSSREALGDLDTICRTGRSQEIGVIFSSQNPSDIPRGLSSVINTKIFFKTDSVAAKQFGISSDELETLDKGYAVANIHELSQLKTLKFPLSYAGVFE